jgi:hypothetical protein
MHSEITNSGITNPTGSTASPGGHPRRQRGPGPIFYGLPCVNCKLYYAAELAVCPICGCGARISPVISLVRPTSML